MPAISNSHIENVQSETPAETASAPIYTSPKRTLVFLQGIEVLLGLIRAPGLASLMDGADWEHARIAG